MLAHDSIPRPLFAAMLDTATIFLRHNLRKRLDVDTYMSVALPSPSRRRKAANSPSSLIAVFAYG